MTRKRDTSKRRIFVMSAMCLTLVAVADRATAGQASAASIIGQVKDESGGVLPGVVVTATSPALQVPSITAVTDAQGEYRLAPLPIGVYAVTYELSGFQAVRQEAIRLTVGFVAKMDITLGLGTVEERVNVTSAAPVVDVTSTTTSTQFTKETLEAIPTNRNGINSLLVQAPGTRGTLEAGGAISFSPPNIRTFGQGAEPWYVLEGIYTPSPQSSGGLGNYWDYGTFEEVNVQTLGTNAEVGGRGAFIAGVVKSGGNVFHGTGYGAYMSSKLQANNITSDLAAQGIRQGNKILWRSDLSADIGGRIVPEKLWFYGAFRDRQNHFNSLGGVMPDGSPAENVQNQRANFTGKLSYQMNPANRFVGFITHNRRYSVSVDRFTPWSSRVDSPLWPWLWKVEWQRARGSIVLDVQWGRWGYTSPPRNTTARLPDISIAPATFDIATQQVGGARIEQNRSWDISRGHPKATVGWYKPNLFMGNHEIKAGVDFMFETATSPRERRESPNYRLVFNNGVPLRIEGFNTPTTPLQKEHYYDVYVQDSWTIQRRLTLNLGIRYNRENPFVPASCREAATPPTDVLFPAACFDRVQFSIVNEVQPRLRAAYDLGGDGRTVIKGGWGRYHYKRILEPDIDAGDPQSATTANFRWRDLNGNRDYDPGEVNWDPSGPDFISTAGIISVGTSGGANFVPSPNETVPKDDEFSLTLERQVGSTLAIRLTGVYTRRFDVLRRTNLLRPASVYTNSLTRPDPGPDGRLGSADDPGTSITYYEYPASIAGRAFERYTRINDPHATQSYKGIDVAVNRALVNRWMLSASFSATRSNNPSLPGLVVPEFASTASAADDDPNSQIFRANQTWEWLAHVTGAYVLPADVMVSLAFESRSGLPWARQVTFTGGVLGSITLNAEPIGTRRLPAISAFDLRIEKGLRLTRNQQAKLRVNIYNLANVNTVTGVTMLSGVRLNAPTAIVQPRIAEFSIAYSF